MARGETSCSPSSSANCHPPTQYNFPRSTEIASGAKFMLKIIALFCLEYFPPSLLSSSKERLIHGFLEGRVQLAKGDVTIVELLKHLRDGRPGYSFYFVLIVWSGYLQFLQSSYHDLFSFHHNRLDMFSLKGLKTRIHLFQRQSGYIFRFCLRDGQDNFLFNCHRLDLFIFFWRDSSPG